MGNILLDRLPQDFEGYLIRTDFGIGVQIALCGADQELSDWEKTATMMSLLYGRGGPDFETSMRGLSWYMSCGKEVESDGDDRADAVMSFDADDIRIYSAFRAKYGIDLQKDRLHWFQFMSLLQDLSGTAYSDVINLRQMNPSDVDPKKRAEFARIKKRFALPNEYTEEEREAIDGFLSQYSQEENEP